MADVTLKLTLTEANAVRDAVQSSYDLNISVLQDNGLKDEYLRRYPDEPGRGRREWEAVGKRAQVLESALRKMS